MEDFASAAMVRLLLRAMASEGLDPPLALPAGARVPVEHKRLVVGAIVRAGGLPLLLRLAQQVHHIESEPLHRALVGARDPQAFLARWQRMERYVHAGHRVMPGRQGPGAMTLTHEACDGSQPGPLAAESVAVLGVWIGALQAIGAQDLEVRIGGRLVHGAAETATPVWPTGPVQTWRLRWAYDPAGPQSPPHAGQSAMPGECWPWPEPALSLARWLVSDPTCSPRVDDAAATLGITPRTLQRRLAQAGLTFSEIVGEVRVRLAAQLLARPMPSLSEIGFLCGYADQAHFTREFTRRAGVPPARYRAASAGN